MTEVAVSTLIAYFKKVVRIFLKSKPFLKKLLIEGRIRCAFARFAILR